jgi:hypothetical protein
MQHYWVLFHKIKEQKQKLLQIELGTEVFRYIDESILASKESSVGVTLGTIKPGLHPSTHTDKHCLSGHFDGLNTFLDFVAENMKTPKQDKSSSIIVYDNENPFGNSNFYTFKTYEECFNIFRKEPGKLERSKESSEKMFDPENAGNQIEYDVTGDYIDMGRYLAGEPESFGSNIYGKLSKRVRIVLTPCASSGVNAEVMLKKSLHISQMVDWLEASGVRTEIVTIQTTGCEYLEVVIKRFEDVFVYNDLLVATHPDFLRRISFRFTEYSPSWEYGYGMPAVTTKFLKSLSDNPKIFDMLNNEHTIIYTAKDVERGYKGVQDAFKRAKTWLESVLPEPIFSDKEMIQLI